MALPVKGDDVGLILFVEEAEEFLVHFSLCGFEKGIEAEEDHHRKNDITVLAAKEHISENVIL